MGLLGSIGKIVKTVTTAVIPTKEKISNVGNVLNAAFNPFSKSTITATTGSKTLNTVLETVANHPYVSAGVVAGGITLATKPALAVSAAKSLIPTSTKGKIAAAVVTPVIVGAVVQKPAQTLKAAISAPSSLANFGGNAANLIAAPSVSNLKTLVTENPVIAASAGLAGAAVIGGGIGLAANTAATFLNTRATKENTGLPEAIPMAAATDTLPSSTQIVQTSATPPVSSIAPTTPVTPQTSAVTRTSRGIKKYKKKAQIPSTISQRVNVMIDSSNNKRYIKRAIYA